MSQNSTVRNLEEEHSEWEELLNEIHLKEQLEEALKDMAMHSEMMNHENKKGKSEDQMLRKRSSYREELSSNNNMMDEQENSNLRMEIEPKFWENVLKYRDLILNISLFWENIDYPNKNPQNNEIKNRCQIRLKSCCVKYERKDKSINLNNKWNTIFFSEVKKPNRSNLECKINLKDYLSRFEFLNFKIEGNEIKFKELVKSHESLKDPVLLFIPVDSKKEENFQIDICPNNWLFIEKNLLPPYSYCKEPILRRTSKITKLSKLVQSNCILIDHDILTFQSFIIGIIYIQKESKIQNATITDHIGNLTASFDSSFKKDQQENLLNDKYTNDDVVVLVESSINLKTGKISHEIIEIDNTFEKMNEVLKSS